MSIPPEWSAPIRRDDPFYSAKRRFRTAIANGEDIVRIVSRFLVDQDKATFVEEVDPQTGDRIAKVKLVGRLPESLDVTMAETFEHLRHALDIACHATARTSARPRPKKTHFPFADNPADLEGIIRRNSKHLPDEIIAVARSLKPYKGGNDALWAVNKAANFK
ncbi:MAG: hypothetical protein ACREOK_00645, partial [Gemmatimonadaceae bacterium]